MGERGFCARVEREIRRKNRGLRLTFEWEEIEERPSGLAGKVRAIPDDPEVWPTVAVARLVDGEITVRKV